MAPSHSHRGPVGADAGPAPGTHDDARGRLRLLTVIGAVVAVVSLGAWAVTLGLAAAGATAPTWITAVALYGLPIAFLIMAAAVAWAFVERRRR
jgi:cation transporter-like permease